MLKNKHNESDLVVCETAEQQLLSVLYGEADAIEEQEFARHLADCKVCQAEFTAFDEIKTTFSIWRENELANFETPGIILPNEEKDFLIVDSKTNWSTKLSEFFLFPKFSWQTTAATTAFVVCAALLLIASFATLDQITLDRSAKNDSPSEQFAQAPNSSDSNNSKDFELSSNSSDSVQPKDNVAAGKIEIKASKTSIPTFKPAVLQNGERRKSASAKAKSVHSGNLPAGVALPAIEEEENSLRLSDLLDEIGSVE